MKTLKELREARAAVNDKIQTALHDADGNLRTLTKEQREAVTNLEGEYDSLTEAIEIAERQEARNANHAKVTVDTRKRRENSTDHENGLNKRASREFSLVKALMDQRNREKNDGIEADVIALGRKEMRAASGIMGEGVTIPSSLIQMGQNKRAAMTAGTAGDGAEYVATDLGDLVPVLALNPVAMSLGATMFTGLQGNLSLPRQTSAFVPTYLGETSNGSESQPETDDIDLTPKRAGGYIDASKLFLIQSTVAAEAWLRGEISRGFDRLIDRWAIYDGPNANGNGALALAGNTVAMGTNGAAPTYAKLVEMTGMVDADYALQGNLKFLTTAAMRAKLKTTAKDSGSGLFAWADDNTISGFDALVSHVLPTNLEKGSSGTVCHAILFGNWSELIIAMWGGVDILNDPYTQANGGKTRFVLNAYADTNVKHANSFAKIVDALNS